MAQLQGSFDPRAVDYAATEIAALPAGTYSAKIIESDERPTKTGMGRIIELTWEVIEGPYAGRRFWQTINYINQNEVAQRIGQAELGRLALACGYEQAINSTEALHGRPCRVTIKIRQQQGFDDRNEVSKVEPFAPPVASPNHLGAVQAPQAPPASMPPAPPPAGGHAPWASPPQPAQRPQDHDDDIPF